MKNKPLTQQLVVIGGFVMFLYLFFSLTTSFYRDYKLDKSIDDFQAQIDELAMLAKKKPEDVLYFESQEYKDKYAKESLNLINPGEKVIMLPQEDRVIKAPAPTRGFTPNDILNETHPKQWWAYFFGPTLSVEVPVPSAPSTKPTDAPVPAAG